MIMKRGREIKKEIKPFKAKQYRTSRWCLRPFFKAFFRKPIGHQGHQVMRRSINVSYRTRIIWRPRSLALIGWMDLRCEIYTSRRESGSDRGTPHRDVSTPRPHSVGKLLSLFSSSHFDVSCWFLCWSFSFSLSHAILCSVVFPD